MGMEEKGNGRKGEEALKGIYQKREYLRHIVRQKGWLWLAGGMILVALFFSLQRIFNVNFVCTNGDYQNYNALRRVLAGQIPYRDFANYLGMGAILLQAPLLLLHNSFAASLFVSHFVAAICFMLLVYLIFYLVTGHKLFSGAAALLLPKLVEAKLFTLIPAFGIYTDYHLGLLAKPNNSMRIVRLFLPVLYCLIALGVLRWRQKRGRPAGLRALVRTPKNCAVLGLSLIHI